MTHRRVAMIAVAGLLICLGAQAGDLHGRVTLMTSGGGAENSDITDAVVFFKPDATLTGTLPMDKASMVMRDKTFHPHVLVVTVGSQVSFPNNDPILHNAFSTSPGDQFDLGLYRNGASKTVTFDHGGLVRVFCNVHHEMYAYILVLDTRYFAHVQADGSFELHGVPKGPGELVVWHPRTPVWREHLSAPDSVPDTIKLHVVRTGVPAHFNKFGKPYKHTPGSGY